MARTRTKRRTRTTDPHARPLTPKQQRFVAEYLIDLNATAAARRAGFGQKAASSIGYEYLRKPHIADAIAAGKAKQLDTADLSAARVLEEYRRLAFIDIRGFFDGHGNLKKLGDLTAEQGSALASMEVIIKNAEAGDGKTDKVHKFKLWDKTRALESLAKHFGLLIEKVELSDDLVDRLARGRQRAAARKAS